MANATIDLDVMATAGLAYENVRKRNADSSMPAWENLPIHARMHFALFTQEIVGVFVERLNRAGVPSVMTNEKPTSH